MIEWAESKVNGRDRVRLVGHPRRLWGMRVVACQEGEAGCAEPSIEALPQVLQGDLDLNGVRRGSTSIFIRA